MAHRIRLGIFGGTFDPIHIGHLVAATNAKFACDLDRVLFMVAGEPWQKTGRRLIAPAESRYRMVQAALGDRPGLEASRLEIDRPGLTYTIDTLLRLREQNPLADLFLIVGTDTAANLWTWHRVEEIAALVHLVVVNRPSRERLGLPGMWTVEEVEIPPLEVSSTELRRRIARGLPVDYLIPSPALGCLQAEGLYAGLQEGELQKKETSPDVEGDGTIRGHIRKAPTNE